ncbi:MAG: biotin--[acetyl-CoA-carboxylase] ligase [Vicinamibacterales bacterium]
MFPLPDEIAEPLARAGTRLGPFAREFHWFADVPSTNDVAGRMAERGAAEGCVVAADAQSAGRGRHGREWISPAGAGLYVSAVLRPAAHVIPLLTIAAGLAVAEGVSAATGLEPRVKWPNDVYIGERKLAGILAEGAVPAGGVPHVILGFGINVLRAALPPDVAARATSLDTELGRAPDRGLVLGECLAALATRYADLQRGEGARVVGAWRARATFLLGHVVEWDGVGTTLRGVAEDIDAEGALLVRMPAGVVRIISGDVRWI